MNHVVKIGKQEIGYAKPIYIVAEIGLNHNADIKIAKKLIADDGSDYTEDKMTTGA